MLSNDYSNYGISQSDMYQMYAYFREYKAKGKNPQNVILLYPYVSNVNEKITFKNQDMNIIIKLIDLRKDFIKNNLEIVVKEAINNN